VPVHIATASRHHHTSAAGNFCHLALVSNTKSYRAFKAKAKDLMHQGQGQAPKDKDFKYQGQGQRLTSLIRFRFDGMNVTDA